MRGHADVAQLVEHRSCKADVAGSIPAVGSETPLSIVAPIRDSNGAVVAALAVEASAAAVTPEDLMRDTGPRLTFAAVSLT